MTPLRPDLTTRKLEERLAELDGLLREREDVNARLAEFLGLAKSSVRAKPQETAFHYACPNCQQRWDDACGMLDAKCPTNVAT